MPRKPTGQPTEVEIDILHVLWDQGPSTLGAIHEAVAQRRQVAYSTTRKMVQVMRDKGLVRSSEQGKPLVYSAAQIQAKNAGRTGQGSRQTCVRWQRQGFNAQSDFISSDFG